MLGDACGVLTYDRLAFHSDVGDECFAHGLCAGCLRYAGADGSGLDLDTVDVSHGFFTIVEGVLVVCSVAGTRQARLARAGVR